MLLFGIYFPARPPWDKRLPWIKYLLIAVFTAVNFGYWAIYIVWQHDVNAAVARGGTFARLSLLKIVCLIVASGGFFANLRRKRAAGLSPDVRRRLDILRVGSWIGLGPMFLLASYAVVIRSELFLHVAWPIAVISPLFLVLFPLTMAYVIVVNHAMDICVVIRSSVKYGFTRAGLWSVRAVLIALAIYLFTATRGITLPEVIGLSAIALGLPMLRQRGADRLSHWIDRNFFRDAYDAERGLAELASEVGRYPEIQPLVERVGGRVSETLHVAEVVILLREREIFRTAFSTRPGEPMDIPAGSRIVTNLRERRGPLEIDFNKPSAWLRSLNTEELQTLDFMRTELLLPLSGGHGIAGVMSLGRKRSGAAYSNAEIRLLQAVAGRTGTALENSHLV
jgi:sigma-B regulation protein RsbU (phosphoserine phosphatase)